MVQIQMPSCSTAAGKVQGSHLCLFGTITVQHVHKRESRIPHDGYETWWVRIGHGDLKVVVLKPGSAASAEERDSLAWRQLRVTQDPGELCSPTWAA